MHALQASLDVAVSPVASQRFIDEARLRLMFGYGAGAAWLRLRQPENAEICLSRGRQAKSTSQPACVPCILCPVPPRPPPGHAGAGPAHPHPHTAKPLGIPHTAC